MATKTQNIRRATKPRANAKRRNRAAAPRKSGNVRQLINFFISLVFILVIVFCLGFLLFMGYRTVTASPFFDAKKIDIRGANRVSRDDIERIVRSQTEKNGVWNANLETVRNEIEKQPFVKSAAVSRILPNGVQVRIDERAAKAIVRLNSGGDFWADDEAILFSTVGKNEQRPPFVLRGWDEAKTDKAQKDNRERVKLFLKLQDEFQSLGISNRVAALNLADLQDAQAAVEDSGETVLVNLGREDYGKRLQKALEVITGKGKEIESLILHGSSVNRTARKN